MVLSTGGVGYFEYEAAVEGDPAAVARLLGWLDRFDFWFKIIEP